MKLTACKDCQHYLGFGGPCVIESDTGEILNTNGKCPHFKEKEE